MFKIKLIVPNFITSMNVVCGVLSVIFAFEGFITEAAYFIVLASVFDFFDGMTARLLGAYSALGKELDSLADLISFGLAPAVIAYHVMKSCTHVETLSFGSTDTSKLLLLFSVVLIPVLSALRLAKFNIDDNQSDKFIGLPTPANALFYASIPIISSKNPFDLYFVYDSYTFLAIIITSSLLLVSPLEMFSLKFRNLKIKENIVRYTFLLISFFIIVFSTVPSLNVLSSFTSKGRILDFFSEIFYIIAKALPIILIVYIFLSLLMIIIHKIKKN